MQTTFLRSSASSNSTKALKDLVAAVQSKVNDASIEPLLRRQPSELRPDVCIDLLGHLSGVSKRGRALKPARGELENESNWAKLVERCTERVLSSVDGQLKLSPRQFTKLCTGLSHLRIGDTARLTKLLPNENDHGAIHVLRHAAETNDNCVRSGAFPWVRLDRALESIRHGENQRWIVPHICLSMAMCIACHGEEIKQDEALQTFMKRLWSTVPLILDHANDHEWQDLGQSSVALDGQATLKPSVLAHLKSLGMQKNENRIISKFQSEVYRMLVRVAPQSTASSIVQETPEGVDIGFTRPSGEKVAIQCYGPTHYVWDQSRLEGRTLLREYMLHKWHGYSRVIRVNVSEWDRLGSQKRVKALTDLISA
jgi:hypothetical protein